MFQQFVVNAFRGGVHRWVIVTFVISMLLVWPVSFLGALGSKIWYNVPVNPAHFVTKNFVNKDFGKVVEAEFLTDETGTADLLGEQKLLYTFVNNQNNKNTGYSPLVYKAQVTDENGAVLSESTEQTYVLPGEATFVSTYSDNPKAALLKIIKLPNSNLVNYNPLVNPLLKKITLDVRESSIVEVDSSNINLKTSIKNNNNFLVKSIDVILIVRDSQDGIVGAKNFRFNDLGPNQERSIELLYPKPLSRTASTLDVRYSVNYLDPENIVVQ